MTARPTPPVAVVFNIGNTTVFCGSSRGGRIDRAFRVPLSELKSATAFARKIAARLPARADSAALCSVVPARTGPLARQIKQAFGVSPRILTAATAKTLKIRYLRPAELGPDRIAGALGARVLHPDANVIVVDCGTATTLTAVDRHGILHGGAILPGVSLWAESLAHRTAQLPLVPLAIPRSPVGKSPRGSITSGIFHGHAGAIREIVRQLQQALFPRGRTIVLGTGGHAALFKGENLFTKIEPRLILTGLSAFAHASDNA